MFLSLSECQNCIVLDDKLKVLPIGLSLNSEEIKLNQNVYMIIKLKINRKKLKIKI